MIKVLYDGWPLIYQPDSPEALHLLTLLEQRHPEVQAVLALPGEVPEWLSESIGYPIQVIAEATSSRLAWEQSRLPGLLGKAGADLLHLTVAHPSLFVSSRTVLSPAEPLEDARNLDRERPKGLRDRLRTAAASGGMPGLRGIIWPQDLSSHVPAGTKTPVFYLAAEPMPGYESNLISDDPDLVKLALPETYILCPPPNGERAANLLLQSWSWAAGPVGEFYPLLVFGLENALTNSIEELIQSYQLGTSIRILPRMPTPLLPSLFRRASAIFHPTQAAPWGGFIRMALRFGKPLVAADTPLAEALVGPAAYLAPGDNPRLLGAGLITVIVEESVAEGLAELGRERASAWNEGDFREGLYAVYQSALR